MRRQGFEDVTVPEQVCMGAYSPSGGRRRRVPAFFSLLLSVALLGCVEGEEVIDKKMADTVRPPGKEVLTIAQVVADKTVYLRKRVTVFGKVAEGGLAFEFVSEQPYALEHRGWRLWVITSEAVPRPGAWITVTGMLVSPYQMKGRHYDLALIEKQRSE